MILTASATSRQRQQGQQEPVRGLACVYPLHGITNGTEHGQKTFRCRRRGNNVNIISNSSSGGSCGGGGKNDNLIITNDNVKIGVLAKAKYFESCDEEVVPMASRSRSNLRFRVDNSGIEVMDSAA